MSANVAYGSALPDQFNLISTHLLTHLSLLADTRELIQERVAVERDYALKLRAIGAKAAGKRTRRASSLVVGDEPSRAWNEDTLRRHTFDTAFQVFLASVENTARDHITLADALSTEVAEALRAVEQRKTDLRKLEVNNYQTLLAERDRVYDQRTKAKQKYDDACITVENLRRKQDGSGEDKYSRQFDQQSVDMWNAKNTYIISIAAANREKEKYFEDDLPVYEDQLQELQTSLTDQLTAILKHANTLHLAHLTRLTTHHASSQNALAKVSPAADQNLYADHNRRPFTMPMDWTFEPCPSHYDTPEMSLEPEPKVFLQNRLSQARSKMGNVIPEAEAKQREVAGLQKILVNYRANPVQGNAEEAAKNLAEASHQAAMLTTILAALEAEVSTLEEVLGGDEGGGKPHSWKSASFSIPTTCAYCNTSIWGLSKQGKTCKACGISVHNKCELKVPAECGMPASAISKRASVSSKPASTVSRSRSDSSASSSTANLTAPSSIGSIPEDKSSAGKASATAAFAFSASSAAELSVKANEVVTIIDDDDGSGWVEVQNTSGDKGVVPASYLVKNTNGGGGTRRPAPPRPVKKPTASGRRVKALFDYEAQSKDELDLTEGETFELVEGGDKDPGWWEGVKDGRKGLFPANYVSLV